MGRNVSNRHNTEVLISCHMDLQFEGANILRVASISYALHRRLGLETWRHHFLWNVSWKKLWQAVG
jgi:hypothetical protein